MLIFVCGLSMSGKSTLIEAAASQVTIRHLRASELLRQCSRPVHPIYASDVLENQKVLVAKVVANLSKSDAIYVLDGHLLIEANEGPVLLPLEALSELPVDKIIFVSVLPEELVKRRRQSGEQIDSTVVANLENSEKQQALLLAEERGVEFIEVQSGDNASFVRQLRQLVKRSEAP